MPFNPYRQYRLPDHLSRSRIPLPMPPRQARMQPARAIPYEASTSSMSYKPVYNSTRASLAATTEDLYAVSPLTAVCTPDSYHMASSYFQSCRSPETADPADMWGSSELLALTYTMTILANSLQRSNLVILMNSIYQARTSALALDP